MQVIGRCSREQDTKVTALADELLVKCPRTRGSCRFTSSPTWALIGTLDFADSGNTPRITIITMGAVGPRNHFCYNSLSIPV